MWEEPQCEELGEVVSSVSLCGEMVGLARFELATSCTPSKRASQAAPQPEDCDGYFGWRTSLPRNYPILAVKARTMLPILRSAWPLHFFRFQKHRKDSFASAGHCYLLRFLPPFVFSDRSLTSTIAFVNGTSRMAAARASMKPASLPRRALRRTNSKLPSKILS